MRTEIEEKAATIEKLRKDIKLTKTFELEQEVRTYLDECQRLRLMVDQLMVQNH